MSETVSSKSVTAKVKRSPRWHGRIPATVLMDPELDSLAVRIFGILALNVWQGNQSYIGQRLVAELCGVSAPTVMRRLRKLEARGHVKAQKCGDGKRSYYMLASEVFGQKQRDNEKTLVSSPDGKRLRLATVRMEVA